MKSKDLIAEAISLPVEERALVVDSILKSFNPVEDEIDKKWVEVANQRLVELRSGNKNKIPGDDVFNKIWDRFSE